MTTKPPPKPKPEPPKFSKNLPKDPKTGQIKLPDTPPDSMPKKP